jgi:hypothetical protein
MYRSRTFKFRWPSVVNAPFETFDTNELLVIARHVIILVAQVQTGAEGVFRVKRLPDMLVPMNWIDNRALVVIC